MGLTQDPARATVAGVRAMAARLLDEPRFAAAAREVAAERAGQPGPATVMERVEAALAA